MLATLRARLSRLTLFQRPRSSGEYDTVDAAAAAEIGQATKLPSLELGLVAGRNAGNCDSGYSCAYSSNVSWKTATTPMAKEIHPRLVFERLFDSGDQSDADRARRRSIHGGLRPF